MRSKTQPHGKFYTVLAPTKNEQEANPTSGGLPKPARGHMVVVLEWATQWNWVKVATITSHVASQSHANDYLPIYPTKKNQQTGIQLKLCNGWDSWTYMQKRSYVRVDEVYEIPFESLEPAGINGVQYELQSKSWDRMHGFVQDRA